MNNLSSVLNARIQILQDLNAALQNALTRALAIVDTAPLNGNGDFYHRRGKKKHESDLLTRLSKPGESRKDALQRLLSMIDKLRKKKSVRRIMADDLDGAQASMYYKWRDELKQYGEV